MKRWLRLHLFEPRSRNFAEEMKFFRKEDSESDKAGALRKFKDDECIAVMVCLYVSHSDDWDENLGMIRVKQEMTLENATWHMGCTACGFGWPSNDISAEKHCGQCGSMHITARQNPEYEKPPDEPAEDDFLQELNRMLKDSTGPNEPDYNLL